jgi:hypothetical protein
MPSLGAALARALPDTMCTGLANRKTSKDMVDNEGVHRKTIPMRDGSAF